MITLSGIRPQLRPQLPAQLRPQTWASVRRPLSFSVFRYDPKGNEGAHFDKYEIKKHECGPMVLDALIKIKNEVDPTLAFRRSCREGICGSCAMNINGKNGLACITPIDSGAEETVLRPLPHSFVQRDLVPDLTNFYQQYESVQPWLQRESVPKEGEAECTQSIEDRKKLDGQYECILCACCSTSCPSYWWNPETFLGPQALLAAHRWVTDSRDEATDDRLKQLNDTMKLYRCHNIQNCADACPKNLKPSIAIQRLKEMVEKKLPQ
ncbi:succinate dehydrogenase iron-sulfur subunit [Gregarina niphandrodes]|uniref:Succinate dehydrogenase [ubiquinone] iron-sulfur subunit, mitochondrial n=1 Tax=Gregarina niphandrodes TaxID=110365 RepID=A0A023BDC3_GRENI|nr:succinate dehydrogenase iron-sulfur subunit [Gregarina niphandrodes]EZG88164.1 succinate dehydrogenase iron-sulfur subunit [Gregarina niphandrodes]|eukprot:XP_011128588.1 succinate dehydrogenase iron-sulfur subunit [Gregarina niphandrodes]